MDNEVGTHEEPSSTRTTDIGLWSTPPGSSGRGRSHASGPALLARLERIPATRAHALWISILALGYCVETFDNVAFAYLAPAIRSEWDLSLGQVGLVTSAAFLGMFIGAVFGGRLSDAFGRRHVLIWASVFYSIASLMSALAPNVEVLAISRVLTGVGVQAATGVLMVYVAEMFPRLSRGRFFSAMMFFGLIATPGTSFIALAIAPTGEGAWRWVFALGAAGLIVAVVVAVFLPESARWLVARNRLREAAEVVADLESSAAQSRRPLLPHVDEQPVQQAGSFRDLFTEQHLRRLIVVSGGFSLLIFCLYGFTSWVPTVLVDRGLSQREALELASLISLGPLLAPILLFLVADHLERKTTLLIAGALAGCSVAVFGSTESAALATVAGVAAQVGLTAASVTFYTYLPEVFPTHVRGIGAGTTNGIGRIAGVISGVAVAGMYGAWGAATLYMVLGAGLLVMGVLIQALGPKTTRRSLEGI